MLAVSLFSTAISGCAADESQGRSAVANVGGGSGWNAAASSGGAGGGGSSAGVHLRSGDCSDVLSPGLTVVDASCGWVTVPEDHRARDGKMIELAVVALKATGSEPRKDPIVFLAGGPGESAIDSLGRWNREVVPRWRETRDVIFFDQRGTGQGRHSLGCFEYANQFAANLSQNLTRTEDLDNLVAAMKTCHERLTDRGVDLGAYTSAQSAADVVDVMSALGYGSFNLVGVSYGTRVALTVMRDAPQQVRSVVLDSPQAIAGHILFAKDAEHAFKALFTACAADAKCGETYPNLESTLADTVQKLDDNPIQVGAYFATGTRYLFGVWERMHQWSFASIPRLIMDVASGKASPPVGLAGSFAFGMSYSVLCSEEYPFDAATHEADVASVSSPYTKLDQLDFETEGVCPFWTKRPADPKEDQDVVSDLPALLLTGSLDTVLPSYYADQVAERLSKSQTVRLEGLGHVTERPRVGVVDGVECAREIARAFLDAPTEAVDTRCLEGIAPIAWE